MTWRSTAHASWCSVFDPAIRMSSIIAAPSIPWSIWSTIFWKISGAHLIPNGRLVPPVPPDWRIERCEQWRGFIKFDLEESAFRDQIWEYLGVRYGDDDLFCGSHRMMLSLHDLVQVTGIDTNADFVALNWNYHRSNPLGWPCYRDYVAIVCLFACLYLSSNKSAVK